MKKSLLPPRAGWLIAAFLFGLVFVVLALIALITDPASRGEPAPATPLSQRPMPAAPTLAPAPAAIMQGDDRPPRLRLLTEDWGTDWTRHTVPYDEIISGGPPRDGIPAIDAPRFVSTEEASQWLGAREPVIALEVAGEARAYPLQILIWHEIVNDVIADTPVAVTFCPLCNAAVVFDRRLGERVLDFGVSGLLRNSDLIMYDRQTESLWQQFTGEGIVGELAGEWLTWLPASIVSFEDFTAGYPQGQVLSRETGYNRAYGRNPYTGYDDIDQSPFLYDGPLDGRLPPMARVVTLSLGGEDVAYPYDVLRAQGVVHDTVGGEAIVLFYEPGAVSALDAGRIAASRDVGATGVFLATLDGRDLTFARDEQGFVDAQTGSRWNILGAAVDGPLAGQRLTPVLHADHFWFSWAAFKPHTRIYQPG
jgi:hypothetical protein